jgi:hypothetical protein
MVLQHHGAKAPIEHRKIGMARSSRPILAGMPPPSPETATASPEAWVRSASRPYLFFTIGAAALPVLRGWDDFFLRSGESFDCSGIY